jgi:hypothetical protein
MENSQNAGNPSSPIGPVDCASFDAPTRRRIAIFGLPREPLLLAAFMSIILGLPVAFIMAMLPLWENVGHLSFVQQLNSYIAPEINHLTDEYRAPGVPRLPLKRLLTGSTCLLELLLLFNFVVLLARPVRQHALLVWTSYDRKKLLKYFGASCIAFFVLWYILFFDWQFLSFTFSSGERGVVRVWMFIIVTMPIMTVIFGRMAAIVGLGAARAVSRLT